MDPLHHEKSKSAAINIICLMCFFLDKSGEVPLIGFSWLLDYYYYYSFIFWQFKMISKWLCTMKVHLTFCVFVLMSKAKSLLLYILMHKVTSFLSLFFPQGLASYQWWISDMHAITRRFNRGKLILEWLHDLNSGTALKPQCPPLWLDLPLFKSALGALRLHIQLLLWCL